SGPTCDADGRWHGRWSECARSWRSELRPSGGCRHERAERHGLEDPDLRTNDRCRDKSVNEFCLLHFTRLDHELVCAVAIDHGSTRTVEIRRLIQQLAVAELARSIAHRDRPTRHAGALGP